MCLLSFERQKWGVCSDCSVCSGCSVCSSIIDWMTFSRPWVRLPDTPIDGYIRFIPSYIEEGTVCCLNKKVSECTYYKLCLLLGDLGSESFDLD